jgi:hypothetical protein
VPSGARTTAPAAPAANRGTVVSQTKGIRRGFIDSPPDHGWSAHPWR